ncbi:hypothetical protein Pyrde_1342 [Pyrodictium delaneyi]|uniref:Uncharacterized protein n=1 Tax=Pyrodictium delaneyi TaxID=1273541 RepID=A0A0P0N458_9CREN|nr:hypothetical protein [Pyrodictium delaneyi]ALL01388.1 hypothetical protein Pyrde_1342 [Pyrodictium delaneyi]OWJ54513.1 hypothetical protein Pdsh_06870 [Pyrodictium delaneyi]
MTLEPYQLLFAALARYGSGGFWLPGESLPGPERLLDADTAFFYVDAGSRTVRQPGGEAFAVKLAVLARASSGGRVEERVLHPAPVHDDGRLGPSIFTMAGSDRARQGISYLVELAMLLTLCEGWQRLLDSHGLPGAEHAIVVRHGPLLQQVHHLLSRAYDVPERVLRAALGYAGLGPGTVNSIVGDARLCRDSGRANIGLAVLSLLRRLAEDASHGDCGVGGVVESVERSRILAASVVADIVHDVARRSASENVASKIWWMSELLKRKIVDALKALGGPDYAADCLCDDPGAVADALDSRREWEQMLTELEQELQLRYGTGLETASREQLEAAIRSSGVLPTSYSDSDLVYGFYYLSPAPGGGVYAATRPRPRRGDTGWLEIVLEERGGEQRLRCHIDEAYRTLDELRKIRYAYIMPRRPPGCSELRGSLGEAGLSPCEAARLLVVPPALRVEYVDGMQGWDTLLSFTGLSASLTVYGYPPQLLVVDKYSRLSLDEAHILKTLLENMSKKSQPYLSFIRGWETRTLLA